MFYQTRCCLCFQKYVKHLQTSAESLILDLYANCSWNALAALQFLHGDETGASRGYQSSVCDTAVFHFFSVIFTSHLFFFFLVPFTESRLITSSSLPTLLEFSHLFPPAASSLHHFLWYPPPHMSVCSKLEQRLNRGSKTWREFLSRLQYRHTHTYAAIKTHISALQPINNLESSAKGIAA